MKTPLYPPSPKTIPKKLTSLTPTYQLKTILAIIAIIVFFLLYFALIIAFAGAVYLAITYDIRVISYITIIIKVCAITGTIMLLAFTLKFLFKLKNPERPNRVKLEKSENPELWYFLQKICEETGAPEPKNIYIDPDVNAYVMYSNVWLSLILPVKKEITIGLGLIDCLNLSEFKAVISHEFGHFAQSSMKIGSYIMSANTIIHDMIYSRDKWDELFEQWKVSGAFGLGAWFIVPIVWVTRQILGLFYQFLNFMYSSLTREMEFNADKFSVRTSGSNAIITALWKLENGTEKWQNTISQAYLAAQKKIHTKNLYIHNQLALQRSTTQQTEKFNALPNDSRGGKRFFLSSENSKVGMYATHPPNDKREENAKNPYILCEEDTRSAWLLFGNKEAIQEKMTKVVYEQYIKKTPTDFSPIEDFEVFIGEEAKGKDLLEEYQNAFKDRFLQIPEIDTLVEEAKTSTHNLPQLKEELSQLMQPIQEIDKLMEKAVQIAEGTTKDKSFEFKGQKYTKKTFTEGIDSLVIEKEKILNENFEEWDKNFLAFHLATATKASKDQELINLYIQHQTITEIYKYIATLKHSALKHLAELQWEAEANNVLITGMNEDFNDFLLTINDKMDQLNDITFVPMPNINSVQELREAIIEEGTFKRGPMLLFETGGVEKWLETIDLAIIHCQRIDQKNLGVILALHKTLNNAPS